MAEESDESSHGKRDADMDAGKSPRSHQRKRNPFESAPPKKRRDSPRQSGSGSGSGHRPKGPRRPRKQQQQHRAAAEEEEVRPEILDEDIINEAAYGTGDGDEEAIEDIGSEFSQLGGGVSGESDGKMYGLWREIHDDPWSKAAIQEYDKVPQYLPAPLQTRLHRERTSLERQYGPSTHPGMAMGHTVFCFLCGWTSDFSEYRIDYDGYESIADFVETLVKEKKRPWSVIATEAASMYEDLRSTYNMELDFDEEELPPCGATTMYDHIVSLPFPEVAAAKTNDYIDTMLEWYARKCMRRINVVTGEEIPNDKAVNVAVRLLSLQKTEQKTGMGASGKAGQALGAGGGSSGGGSGGAGQTTATKQIRGVGRHAIRYGGDHTEAMRK